MKHICGEHMCIKLPMPIEVIKRHFSGDYCYMFNLNPDPSKSHTEGYEKLLSYFVRQGINYWLAQCISADGYLHYHGMLKVRRIKVDIVKTKKAIAKQVNMYMGRAVPLERPDSLVAWYKYIHGDSNNITNEDMYVNVNEEKRSCARGTGGSAAASLSVRLCPSATGVAEQSHYD